MYQKIKTTLFVLLVIGLVASAGHAATASDTQVVTLNIDEVAELTAGAGFTLTIVGSGTPGAAPANPTNSATNLQYTSIVDIGTRKISAKLGTGDAAPAGTSLKLTASGLAASEGTAAVQITLSTTAQDLITLIGSVNTGSAATDGPAMDYVWSIDDVTLLDFGNDTSVTVTFTLSAAA